MTTYATYTKLSHIEESRKAIRALTRAGKESDTYITGISEKSIPEDVYASEIYYEGDGMYVTKDLYDFISYVVLTAEDEVVLLVRDETLPRTLSLAEKLGVELISISSVGG